MEVWGDLVEVLVHPRDGGNKGLPLAPHAVFVGGSVRSDASSGHCICSAEISEECMAGRRVASCQERGCG